MKTLGPLWRLDLADRNLVELTYLDLILSQLEKIFEDETLGHEVLDTLIILAEGVIDGISSPPRTRQQGRDLSIQSPQDTGAMFVSIKTLWRRHPPCRSHEKRRVGLVDQGSWRPRWQARAPCAFTPSSRVTHASSKRQ